MTVISVTRLILQIMSSKSKWDQPASESKPDDAKSASDAAATAAAIAAKIAAQLASGALKDPNAEAAFSQDIDINDVRNRYMLTKGSTQQEVSSLEPLYDTDVKFVV